MHRSNLKDHASAMSSKTDISPCGTDKLFKTTARRQLQKVQLLTYIAVCAPCSWLNGYLADGGRKKDKILHPRQRRRLLWERKRERERERKGEGGKGIS